MPALLCVTGAQTVAAETLRDALAAAYEGNPTLRQARFRLKGINENYVQARSGYGPVVTLEGEARYSNARLMDREVDGNQGSGYLAVTQPLYTGGQLRGQLATARATVQSGQQSLRLIEIQTIQTVIAAYAAVLRDQQRVEVGVENVKVLRRLTEQHIRRRQEGEITLTDENLAKSRLLSGESQLATLEATLEVSRSQYLQAVGHNPGTLEQMPDLTGVPESSDEAYARAEANNPQLLATKYLEEASDAAIATARGAGKPSVSLNAQAGYTGFLSPLDTRNYERDIVASVTIRQPLYSSGLIRSRIRQAKAANNADQTAIDISRRSALQSVASAWAQLYAARKGLLYGVDQVRAAEGAYAGMAHEELNGQRSTLDTLNLEQELASAQLTLLANRYNEYVSRAALLAAMGDLTIDRLAPDVPVYDPDVDFRRVRNRGRSPIEPVVQALDRIGSAKVRRPNSADLTGADVPPADKMIPLPSSPGPDLTTEPLNPITESRRPTLAETERLDSTVRPKPAPQPPARATTEDANPRSNP